MQSSYFMFKLTVAGIPTAFLLILILLSYLTYDEGVERTELTLNGQKQVIRHIKYPKPGKIYAVTSILIVIAFLLVLFGL